MSHVKRARDCVEICYSTRFPFKDVRKAGIKSSYKLQCLKAQKRPVTDMGAIGSEIVTPMLNDADAAIARNAWSAHVVTRAVYN